MNWIDSLRTKSLFTTCARFASTIGSTESVIHGTADLLRPVRQLAVGHYVFRLGKGWHPAPVLEPRVPAHVVDMQVRAHHIIDIVDRQPGRRETLLEAIAVHHVPERARRSWLVIANARIDQNIVARRLDDEALHT